MEKIKKYLQSYDFNLSKNEKLVKNYLIKSNEQQISSKKLSKKLFISQSTVSRYLKKIRYKSLKEFNADLIIQNQDLTTNFDDIVNTKISLIKATNQISQQEKFIKIAKQISNARLIYIYGVGYSEIAGRNLQLRLSRIGFNVILLNNRHDIILQSAAKQMNDVVCLFISQTGETHELIEICLFIQKYNVKSYVITNNEHSPMAKMVDEFLLVPKIYIGYKIETIFSEVTVSVILDQLYYTIIDSNYNQCITNYRQTKAMLTSK